MPRRKRYLVNCIRPDGEAESPYVLGYAEGHIKAFMERAGYIVQNVEYVPPAKHPAAKGKPTWEIDRKALGEAKDILSIKWPVRVSRTYNKKRTGAHVARITPGASTPTHHISARKIAALPQASQTLWHELAHAAQCERASAHIIGATPVQMARAWVLQTQKESRTKYKEQPIEMEARLYEYCADYLPLVKGT